MIDLKEAVETLLEGKSQSSGHITGKLFTEGGVVHRFTTVCSGGVKPEGQSTKRYDSPELAVTDYLESLKAFIAPAIDQPEAVVYWREVPELISDDGTCFVRSRLLVGPPGLKDPE